MQFFHIHPSDNVAVALEHLHQGVEVRLSDYSLTLSTEVAVGHKFALRKLAVGDPVIKYGAPVGVVTEDIEIGDHVHTHNVRTQLSGLEGYICRTQDLLGDNSSSCSKLRFEGYRRSNGVVGTRNEVWVLSTVGCVSKIAERIAQIANTRFEDCCDGVIAFTHPFGCSQIGDDHHNTTAITCALSQHPNAGGVLLVGLGCENNQIKSLLASLPPSHLERVRYFNCQEVDNELSIGIEKIAELVEILKLDKRESCALSDLVIGVKCGGSDGLSGLSANSLVGRISDKVAAANGSVLLTEVPEMFGAEQILMNRAKNKTVFNDIVRLINGFKQYFIDSNQNIYENPSPGNKAGGITTLEEKSMGAIQKGGTATVTGVLNYAEPVKNKGLNLLQAPGNDAVSSTALVASGATVLLFTTGRGTPLGFPAPTIKISSNTRLAKEKSKWIDFDAGRVFQEIGLDALSEELLNRILDVASGRVKTKSEINEQREIAIWKSGVTL